jgi:hypothetical protein
VVLSVTGNPFTVFHRSTTDIEAYLRTQTPLGASHADVIAWLGARDITPQVNNARIRPGSDYPRTSVGGASFIHSSIAHYGLPRVDVEAFYIFDDKNRLVDITVRRTVDGP